MKNNSKRKKITDLRNSIEKNQNTVSNLDKEVITSYAINWKSNILKFETDWITISEAP